MNNNIKIFACKLNEESVIQIPIRNVLRYTHPSYLKKYNFLDRYITLLMTKKIKNTIIKF